MYYIGVDLGGTNIAIGIVDENGKILRKGSVPTNASRENDEIMKDMCALSLSLIKDEGITPDDIEYAGVAAPGTVDNDKGLVIYANNINFINYPLSAKYTELTGIKKVYIANDANAAAKGEAEMGASKGCKDSIMITLGTGLGGGIIINKQVYTGFNHAAGELGHVVIEVDGLPCSCGRKGCWEAYSSATGLINMTKKKLSECPDTIMHKYVKDEGKVSGRTAFNAMRAGDKAGKEVVDKYIKYLASGITTMINIFQPEVLVIGGGICNEGDNLLKPLKAYVDEEQYTSTNDSQTEIRIAKLGNDAGIIGAAMLGF